MTERDPNLSKFLGRCGAASRRTAAELVRAGRVAVNGTVVTDPGRRVVASDSVTLDGKPLFMPANFRYVMLNKPRGYVCSNADRHAEKLAVELIPDPDGRLLRSAGRLDKESEGLIVFSDDGEYLERAAHPRFMVTKLYEVRTARDLSPEDRSRMIRGIRDDGELLRALEVTPLGPRRCRFKLNEGRKREIRRMCRSVGAPVESLKRIALGGLSLGDLPVGQCRDLSPAEVELSLAPDPSAERRPR